MVQQKFPPLHDDKNAQKLKDKIDKMKVAQEKKSHQDSSQGGSRGTLQSPGGQARDS